MKRNRLVLWTVFVLIAGLLAACGGKKEPTPTPEPTRVAAETAETPSASSMSGDPEAGKQVFMGVCIACHGPDAKGLPGLGKSLHPSDSEFIRSKTDDELVEFIKHGRTPDDPLNTTGVAMPPKGGNPGLTDQQLYDVVAYIRSLK